MRVLVLTFAILSSDALAEKPAWTLTLAERAALRADPLGHAERHRAWKADGREAVEADDHVVDGARNPEILTPFELMDSLLGVHSFLDKDRGRKEKFHREWAARRGAEHLGSGFVEELRVLFEPMIAVHYERRRVNATGEYQPVQTENRDCRATAEALVLARATYGEEKFHRFLYEVIAPEVSFSTSSSSPESFYEADRWLDEWRWFEEGCP
jgi:hypothetical protein